MHRSVTATPAEKEEGEEELAAAESTAAAASVAAADGKPRKSAAEMTASLFPLPGGGGSISGSRRSHVAVAEPRADASSELQG